MKELCGIDYYKGLKNKKKVKTTKPSKASRLEKINPVFTRHSLQRLSERICRKYQKVCKTRVGKYLVSYEAIAGWIHPKLISDCIHDIKHSMRDDLLYSEERESFAIRGKIAIYIVARDHTVITVYKEFEKEEKKKYRAVANRDALIFFNL